MIRTAVLVLALVAIAYANPPSSFDARQKWSHCQFNILNQASCGGCWAFATAGAFSDRACISSEAPSGTVMSPEPMIECACGGCNGGNAIGAWNYIIANEDTTCTNQCKGGCAPFDASSGKAPKCHTGKCDNGQNWSPKYSAAKYQSMKKWSISQIQTEIMNNGPVEGSFTVYNNFFNYFDNDPTAVYTKTADGVAGGHEVKFIGWGTSGNTPYWLMANSWGTGFADHGYFRILRGSNFCGIEGNVDEGFTSKQKAELDAAGYVWAEEVEEEDDDTLLPGGWIESEDVENVAYVKAAVAGVEMINKFESRELSFGRILGVKTQVVAGLNLDMVLEMDNGAKLSMVLYRDLENKFDLKSYEFVF